MLSLLDEAVSAVDEYADGLSSIAAPIRDAAGRVLGALHVYGPTYRFHAERDPKIVASYSQTVESLQRAVLGILDRHRVKYSIDWIIAGAPFLTPPGVLTDAVSSAVLEITGRMPQFSTTGGTSDGRFIAPTGAQVVELGVGNATIHKVNECARVADIERLKNIA